MKRFLLVIALGAATPLGAQLPPGYYEGDRAPLPDSLRETYLGGRFVISVTRVARDSVGRELLARAEALMPPADSIEQRASRVSGSGHVAAFKVAKDAPGHRWWWREWDGVWLPFALTGPAAVHYVERVRALAAAQNPFARWNQGVDHRARVAYTAVVAPAGSTGTRWVTLRVRFSFYCGPMCALAFEHSRRIEFDRAGRPIRVEGDGPPSYVVS